MARASSRPPIRRACPSHDAARVANRRRPLRLRSRDRWRVGRVTRKNSGRAVTGPGCPGMRFDRSAANGRHQTWASPRPSGRGQHSHVGPRWVALTLGRAYERDRRVARDTAYTAPCRARRSASPMPEFAWMSGAAMRGGSARLAMALLDPRPRTLRPGRAGVRRRVMFWYVAMTGSARRDDGRTPTKMSRGAASSRARSFDMSRHDDGARVTTPRRAGRPTLPFSDDDHSFRKTGWVQRMPPSEPSTRVRT